MFTLAGILTISTGVLVCLAFVLFIYAFYLRWKTEGHSRLILAKKNVWNARIEFWLENCSLIEPNEDNPREFLRFIGQECEKLKQEERLKLGELVTQMGLLDNLRQLIKTDDLVVKAWAIHLAGMLGLKVLKDDVIGYLKDPSELLVYSTTLTLARLLDFDDPLYLEVFNKLLDRIDEWTNEKLAEVILLMGPKAGVLLLNLIEDGKRVDNKKLWFIMDLLGEMKVKKAVPVLLTFLNSESETVVHAIRSLGLIGYQLSIINIKILLKHPDWVVRAQTAKVLGNYKEVQVIPELINALKDTNWWVRYNAANSLIQFGESGKANLRKVIIKGKDRYAADMAKYVLEYRGESLGVA